MPSKGSPIVTLRIPADLLAQVERAVESNNDHRSGQPYDRTAWIIQAIRERLDKQRRGARGKARAGRPTEAPSVPEAGPGQGEE